MIGELLGHNLVASTARYAHLDEERPLDAAKAFRAGIERAMFHGTARSITIRSLKHNTKYDR